MTTHPCGCVVAPSPTYGVLRSVAKCPKHRREHHDPATLDEAYYRENGALDADAPVRYVGELVEALGELPEPSRQPAFAMEIGCGVSPYAGTLRALGYAYFGIDASPWAVAWMRRAFGQNAAGVADFESLRLSQGNYALILAAHVFEHLSYASTALQHAADCLAPGGELWLIVPDDEDQCNPDHLWFADESGWRRLVEAAGLVVERSTTIRRIERESFVYLKARKP